MPRASWRPMAMCSRPPSGRLTRSRSARGSRSRCPGRGDVWPRRRARAWHLARLRRPRCAFGADHVPLRCPETCDLLLAVCGQALERMASALTAKAPTNDTVILQFQPVPPGSRLRPSQTTRLRFGEALDAVHAATGAVDRAGRGGRATDRARRVRGRRSMRSHRRPRSRRTLPLVKIALYGGGPELGQDHPGCRCGDARHRAASGGHLDRGRPTVRVTR